MANYPTSAPSFSNKSNGQTIDASHINSLQDEVVAIGGGLLNGSAPLNSSKSTLAALSVTGGSTLETLVVSSLATLSGNVAIGGGLNVTGAILTAGDMTSSGIVASGTPVFSGVIQPAALSSGDTHNYSPSGFGDVFGLKVTAAAGGSTLTGLTAQAAGSLRLLIAAGGANLGIANEDAGSSAANRILTKSGTDTSLVSAYGTMLLWYDDGVSRWRQIG